MNWIKQLIGISRKSKEAEDLMQSKTSKLLKSSSNTLENYHYLENSRATTTFRSSKGLDITPKLPNRLREN